MPILIVKESEKNNDLSKKRKEKSALLNATSSEKLLSIPVGNESMLDIMNVKVYKLTNPGLNDSTAKSFLIGSDYYVKEEIEKFKEKKSSVVDTNLSTKHKLNGHLLQKIRLMKYINRTETSNKKRFNTEYFLSTALKDGENLNLLKSGHPCDQFSHFPTISESLEFLISDLNRQEDVDLIDRVIQLDKNIKSFDMFKR